MIFNDFVNFSWCDVDIVLCMICMLLEYLVGCNFGEVCYVFCVSECYLEGCDVMEFVMLYWIVLDDFFFDYLSVVWCC